MRPSCLLAYFVERVHTMEFVHGRAWCARRPVFMYSQQRLACMVCTLVPGCIGGWCVNAFDACLGEWLVKRFSASGQFWACYVKGSLGQLASLEPVHLCFGFDVEPAVEHCCMNKRTALSLYHATHSLFCVAVMLLIFPRCLLRSMRSAHRHSSPLCLGSSVSSSLQAVFSFWLGISLVFFHIALA